MTHRSRRTVNDTVLHSEKNPSIGTGTVFAKLSQFRWRFRAQLHVQEIARRNQEHIMRLVAKCWKKYGMITSMRNERSSRRIADRIARADRSRQVQGRLRSLLQLQR